MKRDGTSMHLSEIVIGYGMTETSPASFASATNDTLERRVATVGWVLPHVEAKVISLRHLPRSRARCCNMRNSPLVQRFQIVDML